jgi:uncharacterized protein
MKRLILLFIIFPWILISQNFPPKPTNYITDEVSILTSEEISNLNQKLKTFEDSTSNQIFIYIASSLNEKDLTSYTQDIFHAWEIGQKELNNGVLITIFIDDHKFRIHTGYGMEGVLPDITTKHIQDDFMKPLFKEGKYYDGINNGVDQLIYFSKNEFKPIDTAESSFDSLIAFYAFSFILVVIIFFVCRGIKDKPIIKKILIIFSIILFLIPVLGSVFLVFLLLISLVARNGLPKKSRHINRGSFSNSSWSNSESTSSWSSSDSDSSFDGGGGGDSGGGGGSSDW